MAERDPGNRMRASKRESTVSEVGFLFSKSVRGVRSLIAGYVGTSLFVARRAIKSAVILFGVFLSLSITSLNAKNSFDKKIDPRALKEMFDKVAIHRQQKANDGIILKWDHPVRVVIISRTDANSEFSTKISDQLVTIERLSKIDVKIVANQANFIFILADDLLSEAEQQRNLLNFFFGNQKSVDPFIEAVKADNTGCVQVLKPGANYRIQAYVAFISTNSQKYGKDKIINCLLRAMMTGFGFVEDTVNVDSIYDKSESKTSFSIYDEEIVKLLYDKELISGESRSVVFEKIFPALQEFNK